MWCMVADGMVDFGTVKVDADCGLNGPFPDKVVDSQRIKIATKLRQ